MSLWREGDKISYQGYKGNNTKITETYRKNVSIVNVTHSPPVKHGPKVIQIGLFEYPDGRLEFMNKLYDND